MISSHLACYFIGVFAGFITYRTFDDKEKCRSSIFHRSARYIRNTMEEQQKQ